MNSWKNTGWNQLIGVRNMESNTTRKEHVEMTFEEAQIALEELTNDLPPEILTGLNCGVALTEETLYDEAGLIILGQYHFDPRGLGRYVTVHYGSMMEVYGGYPPHAFRDKLKFVLHHELVHHLESMAGDRSLEIQDAIDKAKMLGDDFG